MIGAGIGRERRREEESGGERNVGKDKDEGIQRENEKIRRRGQIDGIHFPPCQIIELYRETLPCPSFKVCDVVSNCGGGKYIKSSSLFLLVPLPPPPAAAVKCPGTWEALETLP